MRSKNQFSKYANEYKSYNIIQQICAKSLIRELKTEAKTILELGCGSGQIFSNITWDFDRYLAIDSSQDMCNLHPKAENLEVKCMDFDSEEFFKEIDKSHFDMVISSSALQWSSDLERVVNSLSKITKEVNAVLFTSNTFKTIQNITNTKSTILDESSIKDAFSKYFICDFETILYKLEFDSKKELFSYIKRSGVSSSATLSYEVAKRLYKEYDLPYLEFEVIFIKARKD